MTTNEKLSYRIDEWCATTGMGRTTTYAEIKAGRLRTVKVGRMTLIRAEDGKAYLDALAHQPAGRA